MNNWTLNLGFESNITPKYFIYDCEVISHSPMVSDILSSSFLVLLSKSSVLCSASFKLMEENHWCRPFMHSLHLLRRPSRCLVSLCLFSVSCAEYSTKRVQNPNILSTFYKYQSNYVPNLIEAIRKVLVSFEYSHKLS